MNPIPANTMMKMVGITGPKTTVIPRIKPRMNSAKCIGTRKANNRKINGTSCRIGWKSLTKDIEMIKAQTNAPANKLSISCLDLFLSVMVVDLSSRFRLRPTRIQVITGKINSPHQFENFGRSALCRI